MDVRLDNNGDDTNSLSFFRTLAPGGDTSTSTGAIPELNKAVGEAFPLGIYIKRNGTFNTYDFDYEIYVDFKLVASGNVLSGPRTFAYNSATDEVSVRWGESGRSLSEYPLDVARSAIIAGPLSTEQLGALEDAYSQTQTDYVDPTPGCIPPP